MKIFKDSYILNILSRLFFFNTEIETFRATFISHLKAFTKYQYEEGWIDKQVHNWNFK